MLRAVFVEAELLFHEFERSGLKELVFKELTGRLAFCLVGHVILVLGVQDRVTVTLVIKELIRPGDVDPELVVEDDPERVTFSEGLTDAPRLLVNETTDS